MAKVVFTFDESMANVEDYINADILIEVDAVALQGVCLAPGDTFTTKESFVESITFTGRKRNT